MEAKDRKPRNAVTHEELLRAHSAAMVFRNDLENKTKAEFHDIIKDKTGIDLSENAVATIADSAGIKIKLLRQPTRSAGVDELAAIVLTIAEGIGYDDQEALNSLRDLAGAN